MCIYNHKKLYIWRERERDCTYCSILSLWSVPEQHLKTWKSFVGCQSCFHRCTGAPGLSKTCKKHPYSVKMFFSSRVVSYVLQTHLIQYIAYETCISNIVLYTYMCIIVHTLCTQVGENPSHYWQFIQPPTLLSKEWSATDASCFVEGFCCEDDADRMFAGAVLRGSRQFGEEVLIGTDLIFFEWRCWLFWRR